MQRNFNALEKMLIVDDFFAEFIQQLKTKQVLMIGESEIMTDASDTAERKEQTRMSTAYDILMKEIVMDSWLFYAFGQSFNANRQAIQRIFGFLIVNIGNVAAAGTSTTSTNIPSTITTTLNTTTTTSSSSTSSSNSGNSGNNSNSIEHPSSILLSSSASSSSNNVINTIGLTAELLLCNLCFGMLQFQ